MINIERELFALLPKGVTEIMPNHCHNRVTFYSKDSDKSREQIAKLKEIFSGESIFGQIIPEPDWANTPLLTSDNHYGTKYGNDGELPQKVVDPWERSVFKSTGLTDQRWYDWRLQNWDTKWDAYDVEQHDFDDPDQYEVTFNTAWCPPDAICAQIREDYPDVSVSWFYDEPGCEIAGYM